MFQPDYFIAEYLTSVLDDDDDCEITVRHPGKVFYLRLSPSQFRESPKAASHYLKCLNLLQSGEQVINEFYEDEAQEWLLKPFEPLIEELAVEPPGGLGTPTLEDYFDAEFFVFTLDVEREERRTRRVHVKDSPRIDWVRITREVAEGLDAWTTTHHRSQVEICYKRPQDVLRREPRRVRIKGTQDIYFFKQFPCAMPEVVSRELQAFKRISKAQLHPDVRVCRLHGVIGDGDQFLGMLLTLVDERTTLRWAKSTASVLQKEKWAAQIKESVAALHEAGLVWGDVKPDNILIDTNDDAWLIDFGGSYTEGWVDKEEAGTIDGDLHGLDRVLEFLA